MGKFNKGDLVVSLNHPHKPLQNRYRIIGVIGDMPSNPIVPTEKINISKGMEYLLQLELQIEPPEEFKKDFYQWVEVNETMIELFK